MNIYIFEIRNEQGDIINKYKFKNPKIKKIKIGSGKENDIIIDFYTLSKNHFELYFTKNQKLSIKLLDSKYPIFKNKYQIYKNQFQLVCNEDKIFFYDSKFFLFYKYIYYN